MTLKLDMNLPQKSPLNLALFFSAVGGAHLSCKIILSSSTALLDQGDNAEPNQDLNEK